MNFGDALRALRPDLMKEVADGMAGKLPHESVTADLIDRMQEDIPILGFLCGHLAEKLRVDELSEEVVEGFMLGAFSVALTLYEYAATEDMHRQFPDAPRA